MLAINKCNILTKKGSKIQCDKCESNYHLGCAGLSKSAYIPTTLWYCYQCHEDIFPFINISVKQVSNLSFNSLYVDKHPNQIRSMYNSSHNSPEINNICMFVPKRSAVPIHLFHAHHVTALSTCHALNCQKNYLMI